MLTASNIEKSFGNKKVLDGVHLTVHQGDVVVILGPSGSGKTTFLRTLNHLETADKGQLALDSKTYDLAKIQQKEILELRKKTAFVFQNYNLFANKTAIENILEGLVIARKIPKKEAIIIAEEALAKVGLLDRRDAYPSQLSGGQQQRVCIARVLAIEPEVILLDEPTSAWDPISSAQIERMLMELKNEYTMIIVTHNMQQASRISDNTAFFLSGELIEFGETSQIFTNPKKKQTEDYISGRFG